MVKALPSFTIVNKATLPFVVTGRQNNESETFFHVMPAVAFKADFLLMWGVTLKTRVTSVRVGGIECLSACGGLSIPAGLFVISQAPELSADELTPNWYSAVDLPVIPPSHSCSIGIIGPLTDMVLLGRALIQVGA